MARRSKKSETQARSGEAMKSLRDVQRLSELTRASVSIGRASDGLAIVSSVQKMGLASQAGVTTDRTRTSDAGHDESSESIRNFDVAEFGSRLTAALSGLKRLEQIQVELSMLGSRRGSSATFAPDQSNASSSISGANLLASLAAPSASLIQILQQPGIVTARESGGVGALAEVPEALSTKPWHQLDDSSNRLSSMGDLISPSARNDRSISSIGTRGLGDRRALFNTGTATSLKPSILAAPRIDRAEFAEPRSLGPSRSAESASGGISINSSPTVIIHSAQDHADIERQVVGALRKHREQLFEQVKQEAARRERALY